MKWIAIAGLLASIFPLAGWLRHNPREVPKFWMLMGVLPFVMVTFHLFVAIDSWADWPGYVKGAEFSTLDALAIALYLSLPRTSQRIPFRLSMALYFTAVLLSVFQAGIPMASLFYAWQLARVFLVYCVVTKACAVDERTAPALLTGMAFGLCFEACDVIWERFGLGILQAGGSIGHQNFLGMMSHFVVFPWFALLLAGERGWRAFLGPVSGVIVEVLTVSRATIGLAGMGYAGLFLLSSFRGWTSRKAILLAAGVVAVSVLTPLIISSFNKRFEIEQRTIGTEYDERAAFEAAAGMIISDHPLGVGANSYVVVANVDGYNTRAKVAAIIGSDSANVHNIYYLVTAETGYIGLITFVWLLLQPLIVAFRCGWRNPKDKRGDLLLGLGMALLVVYIHSYFEWIFIEFQTQYMFALDVGMVAGLATQMGYWRLSQVGSRLGAVAPVAKST